MSFRRHTHNLSEREGSRACRHVQAHMAGFLDGELPARDAQAMAQHLAECAFCRREQEQWQQAERALATARQQVPSPGDLRPGFYARLAATAPRSRFGARIDWRVAVPTLAACGLAFGWLTARHTVSTTPATGDTTLATVVPSSSVRRQIAQAEDGRSHQVPAPSSFADSEPTPHRSSALAAQSVQAKPDKGVSPGNTDRAERVVPAAANARSRGTEKRLAAAAALRPAPAAIVSAHLAVELRRSHLLSGATQLGMDDKTARYLPETFREALDAGKPLLWNSAQNKDLASKQARSRERAWGFSYQEAEALVPADKDRDNYGYAMMAKKAKAPLAQSGAFGESERQMPAAGAGTLRALSSDMALARESTSGAGAAFGRRTLAYDGYGLGASGLATMDVGEAEGVELQVRDAQRGFTSGTRLAGQLEEQNGRRVLTILAEDEATDAPPAEAQ